MKFINQIRQLFARPIAINATPLTPTITSRGTESMAADATVTFLNAVVKKGSDDRHFGAVTTTQTDVPYGVLLNDKVDIGEAGVIQKFVAIFGLYPESLDCVSDGTGTIAVNGEVVASATTAGQVRAKPTTSGQAYLVIGRSRFAVAATAGDPVSLVHCCPRAVTNP